MKRHTLISLIIAYGVSAPAICFAQANGKEVLMAVQMQDLDGLKTLLPKSGKLTYRENGRPILGWAAQNGNAEIVQALLDAGADPNEFDEHPGHTPLMRALDLQQVDIVRALLKGKADPNAKSKDGKSCLAMAVESGKPELVQALLDAGADAKASTGSGDSPVLIAAQDGSPASLQIIQQLGKAHADMNAPNSAYTPLSYAIEQGKPELVEALLNAGADPNKPDPNGTSPLKAAQDSSNDAIVALLQKHGAMGPAASSASAADVAASGGGGCTIVDAAKRLMEVHALLQAQVNAGKMDSEIFRTYNEDTKSFGELEVSNPDEACKLLDRLRVKYGV